MGQVRLRRSIKDFEIDITFTTDYIQQPCDPSPSINGLRLGWMQAEIDQWVGFKTAWAPLYVKYGNKKATRTTQVKDSLNAIIAEAVSYEKQKHLYERIAVSPNATIMDYEAFKIKRGTPLEDKIATPAPPPGNKRVAIALKKMGHTFHQLLVTSPEKEGRGKETGVKEILMYKAVTAADAAAPAITAYQYVGDVSRGLINIDHLDTEVGKKAWYFARIKNSRGEIGMPGEVVFFLIV